jgi:hypothetical protein
LIYGTCSLLQDENEAIAEAFLSAHPDFKLIPANEILAQQQIPLDTGEYLKLLPHLHGTDGFFAAVFERNAENAKAKPEGKMTVPEGNIHAASGASPAKEKITKTKKLKESS